MRLAVERSLQKLPSRRWDFDDIESVLCGRFLEPFDLLAAVSAFVMLHSFVYVFLTVLQHPAH